MWRYYPCHPPRRGKSVRVFEHFKLGLKFTQIARHFITYTRYKDVHPYSQFSILNFSSFKQFSILNSQFSILILNSQFSFSILNSHSPYSLLPNPQLPSILPWCQIVLALKMAIEVGHIFEPRLIANFRHVQVRLQE